MRLNLPGKHLVVVGFWSDWGYLNDVLADAFTLATAESVTVVSPGDTAALKVKAPTLWDRLHTMSNQFLHVQASGDVFLAELRRVFSEVWHRKFLKYGETLLPAVSTFSAAGSAMASLAEEDLYDIRRDAEAVPYTSAATSKSPAVGTAEAASLRIRMLDKGATEERSWLRLDGKSVRIVNGAGRNLEDVRKHYKEPPTLPEADFVVCAGAKALGVPTGLISRGTPAGLVRAVAGSGSKWITTSEAEMEFKL